MVPVSYEFEGLDAVLGKELGMASGEDVVDVCDEKLDI
jgi:hypothetical protein